MMKVMIAATALLALAACNNQSGVMSEIQRAEEAGRVTEEPQTLPSGLEVQFTRRGPDQTTQQPGPDSLVLVHYEGSFPESGEVFDSSFQRGEPAEFPLNAVVPGFSEAIQMMHPGDELIATMPGNLGYGAEGRPPVIAPNAALRFRIQLLAFRAADGSIVGNVPGR